MQNNIKLFINQAEIILRNANIIILFYSVFISILISFLISYRQKYLFKIINKNIPVYNLWLYGAASMIASLLTPFFAGSLTFAYLVSKKYKIPYLKVFGVVLLDFVIGLTFTVIFGLIGTLYWGVKKPFIILGFLIIVGFLILAIFRNKSFKIFKELIKNKKYVLKSLIISSVIFILGNIQSYLFLISFGIITNFIKFVFASSLFGLMNLLPGIPAKIGQYELVGAVTYWYLLGIDKLSIGSVLLAQHFISLSISILIGIIAIFLLRVKKTSVKK